MTLLDKLQARVSTRAPSSNRLAIGLTPAPEVVGTEAAVKVASLISRLKSSANIPESWLPPEDDAPLRVEGSHELDRIAALPRRPADWPHVPDLSPIYVHTPGRCNGGCGLCESGAPVAMKRVQSAAVFEAVQENGALLPIGVGWGKTLIMLLLHDAMHANRTVLMVQPDLRDQLLKIDIPRYERHFVLPHVALWDGTPRDGQVTLIAYSTLSSPKHADVLDKVCPDLLACDEGHNLRHKTSARSKRFFRFTNEHPETRVVIASGSMATRSIKDASNLSHACLRARSPYPVHYPTLSSWALALDVLPDPNAENIDPGALYDAFASAQDRAAVAAGDMTVTEAARRGFGRRMAETPGVVATDDGGAGMDLEIKPWTPWAAQRYYGSGEHGLPQVIKTAMQTVQDQWRTPDGEEELEDGAAVARVMKQLAAGFYYVWDWGPGGRDVEWLAARANWHVVLRNVLSRSQKGLDSPMLVARAVERGEMDHEATLAWQDWKAVKGRYNPTPPTRAIWLSDFLIDGVNLWAMRRQQPSAADIGNGIVWFSHVPVADKLEALGLKVFRGGSDSSAILAADPLYSEHAVICASIAAHGTGKNLQRYSSNLVTTPPANGTKWEQLLGRTHRPGQRADVVTFDVALYTPHLQAAFDKAMEDAKFQQSVQGQRQKLLMARIFDGQI